MPVLFQSCKSCCFSSLTLSLNNYTSAYCQLQNVVLPTNPKCPAPKTTCIYPLFSIGSPVSSIFCNNSQNLGSTHLTFSSRDNVFNGLSSSQFSNNREDFIVEDNEELELLHKPSPSSISNGSVEDEKLDKDQVLEPFLKFFKPRDSMDELGEEENELEISEENSDLDDEEVKNVNVEYYEPKPGDFVVGVVVSGNENKLDVNVGADFLGTMLTKEVLPLYDKEMEYLLCDTAEDFMVRGKLGIVKNDEAISGGPLPGKPVVETGTVLFAEVLGRTLSGRPLLSTRRLFRRIAWHRVRQIKQLNEPIEVRITEWNTGGLLTRIEGLRAFLPKAELLKRVNSFTELKENVGRQMYVQITRINEDTNDFILSEKEAWEILNLREGTLLEGTVKKIFPYGAQIRIGETNRSGLLHISNISRARITSVSDLLTVDEKVKVLVLKPTFPDKISLSIADLESEPGLFISNKEKVFSEAEMMARKYRQKLPAALANQKSESSPNDGLKFENEATMYANWKWFKFEKECQPN